jgi:hypothetical protein
VVDLKHCNYYLESYLGSLASVADSILILLRTIVVVVVIIDVVHILLKFRVVTP